MGLCAEHPSASCPFAYSLQLSVRHHLFGAGASTHAGSTADGAYALDVGGVAGMVASAASATVTGVANMMTTEAGLSIQGSAMKLQWCAPSNLELAW